MIVAYIRPDKFFAPAHEQLQQINSYALSHNFIIDDEFIDYTSQNRRIQERSDVTDYFQSKHKATLLIYDIWVLSTNMEDLVQMLSCLLKNEFSVHFIKQSVIITQQSSVMLVLGLIDQLRKSIQSDAKRVIGRPKGSRSSSKFDQYISEILSFVKEGKSVSEMARVLGVSRSSLKDYVESRELKQLAVDSLVVKRANDAEENVINRIICPNTNKGDK